MRPGRVLLRVPAALRPAVARAVATCLALLLVVPVPVAGGIAAPSPDPADDASSPAAVAADPGTDPAPPAAPLPAPPGTTTIVSYRFGGSATAGPTAGGPSAEASISSNGRYVAFTSGAPDLVTGDTNGVLDVFVLDRSRGTMTRLGLPGGAPVPPGGRASQPSISADGRIVAFTYQPSSGFATVVVGTMILAWDRQTGNVEVVSRNPDGTTAGASRQPSVSGDGRYVAYVSDAATIAGKDGNSKPDVFRYDRTTHQTVLISARPDGISTPPGTSNDPSISADGNRVAFVSDANEGILNEATGPGTQIYVRDVEAAQTTRVSAAPGAGPGGPADGPALSPSISGDGRYVVFGSSATNLVPGDSNKANDVFRRDLQTNTTTLVSVTPDGVPATGASGQASISTDGRVIAFASTASNLVALAGGIAPAAVVLGGSEVFARDMDAGQTVLVSATPAGEPGGGVSITPVVNGDGRFIAFPSTAGGLVKGDANDVSDVFLRDMPPVPMLNPAVLDLGARSVGVASLPAAAVLSNTGWTPLRVIGATITGSAAADFSVVADLCSGAVLHRGEACTVSVVFTPTTAGTRTAVLEVADAYTGSPRMARLTGTASLAKVELNPKIGPPGIVTIATGTGFPPNTPVKLAWSDGITPKMPPVVSDARGSFRVQVLVFHNDRTGPRELTAEAVDGTSFPPTATPMFITQPPTVPPSFVILRLLDLPIALVIRG